MPDQDVYNQPMTIHDVLGEWDHGLSIMRRDRAIAAIFHQPHTVLGSAMFGSGMRTYLQGVINLQTCEAKGLDYHPTMAFIRDDAAQMAERFGLAPAHVTTMGTAASMRCHGIAEAWYEDTNCPKVGVIAVATAGVESNAGRAGDPTQWVELNGDYFPREAPTEPQSHPRDSIPSQADARGDAPEAAPAQPRPRDGAGTINILVCFSAPLKPTAFGCAIISATEAKSAVLADYAVGSLYSPGLATGTGTDQMVITAPTNGPHFLSGVGHHTVMGELLGHTVMQAVRAALRQQNGMTPASRCNVIAQLSRFGLDRDRFIAEAAPFLEDRVCAHLQENLHAIIHDPVVVGLAASIGTVADQLRNAIIPLSVANELAIRLGGQIALAVCTDRTPAIAVHDVLTSAPFDPAVLVPRAVALGWANRWDWSR